MVTAYAGDIVDTAASDATVAAVAAVAAAEAEGLAFIKTFGVPDVAASTLSMFIETFRVPDTGGKAWAVPLQLRSKSEFTGSIVFTLCTLPMVIGTFGVPDACW